MTEVEHPFKMYSGFVLWYRDIFCYVQYSFPKNNWHHSCFSESIIFNLLKNSNIFFMRDNSYFRMHWCVCIQWVAFPVCGTLSLSVIYLSVNCSVTYLQHVLPQSFASGFCICCPELIIMIRCCHLTFITFYKFMKTCHGLPFMSMLKRIRFS